MRPCSDFDMLWRLMKCRIIIIIIIIILSYLLNTYTVRDARCCVTRLGCRLDVNSCIHSSQVAVNTCTSLKMLSEWVNVLPEYCCSRLGSMNDGCCCWTGNVVTATGAGRTVGGVLTDVTLAATLPPFTTTPLPPPTSHTHTHTDTPSYPLSRASWPTNTCHRCDIAQSTNIIFMCTRCACLLKASCCRYCIYTCSVSLWMVVLIMAQNRPLWRLLLRVALRTLKPRLHQDNMLPATSNMMPGNMLPWCKRGFSGASQKWWHDDDNDDDASKTLLKQSEWFTRVLFVKTTWIKERLQVTCQQQQ